MHNQKHSEESKKKMSESCKKRWKDKKYREHMRKVHLGQKAWNKGTKGIMKPNSTSFKKGEHPSKKTQFKKGDEKITGENNPNWKGGISYEPYSVDWTKTLRRSIRERDKYTCQICGKPQEDVIHNVHHIDYDKQNSNPSNLITLCHSCHSKTNFNRNKWIEYFNNNK